APPDGGGGLPAPDRRLCARRLRAHDVPGLRGRDPGWTPVSTPVVSVVVPTFNRASFIGASVASVLAETRVDLEVTGVADGSTDATLARLATIADPRLRVVEAAHGGVGAARNVGVAAARGRYVAFHDSDDEALPGRLARPVALLAERPELGLVIMNG